MFINVLWKSPQKQFTGETYRFTITLDTSASSTSKSSTLTTPAESHPVPREQVDRAFLRPADGLRSQSSGSSNGSNRAPAGGRHVHACGAFVSGANPSSFTFQNETVGAKKKEKKRKTKTRQSRGAAPAVKDTTVGRLSHCSDAFGSAAEQTRILKSRKEKERKPGEICETHKDTGSVNLRMLEKCPTPSFRTLNDKPRESEVMWEFQFIPGDGNTSYEI